MLLASDTPAQVSRPSPATDGKKFDGDNYGDGVDNIDNEEVLT